MGKPCDGPYLPVGFCLTTHPAVSYWCVMVDLSPKLSGFGLDLDLLWAVLGLLWGGWRTCVLHNLWCHTCTVVPKLYSSLTSLLLRLPILSHPIHCHCHVGVQLWWRPRAARLGLSARWMELGLCAYLACYRPWWSISWAWLCLGMLLMGVELGWRMVVQEGQCAIDGGASTTSRLLPMDGAQPYWQSPDVFIVVQCWVLCQACCKQLDDCIASKLSRLIQQRKTTQTHPHTHPGFDWLLWVQAYLHTVYGGSSVVGLDWLSTM